MLVFPQAIRDWSNRVVRTPALAWMAFAACMFAFGFGTWGWYGAFFAEVDAPWWSIPFIPDCPLAAGLFGVALLLMHYRRSSNLLNHIAAAACIKYGTWTMLFWGLYWLATGNVELSSVFSGPIMFLTHFGLTIMGLLMTQYVRPSVRDAVLVLAWMAASDVVDYAPLAAGRLGGYGYYPPLPPVNGDPVALVPPMMAHAVGMTVLLGVGALAWAWRAQHNARRVAPRVSLEAMGEK
ncbi:MAG: DUF1405 domain-containing protein [Thermoflexales bacterium]|nr:DUF1405 domain-containing protein [Thermoflexales bacterium]MCS7324701.1 DUF1405 domain-containing protein [Thermoflexales bacterium]MDW8054086.1 DUF1405 domain-containing protein [Anaerolineae bacterium]